VTGLLAAQTANVLHGLRHSFVAVIYLLVVLRLVLRILTARLILFVLSAAPPDFTAPLAQVHSAAPIEIFLIEVLLVATFACLLRHVMFALASFKLFHAILHFLAFSDKVLLFLLEYNPRIKIFLSVICHLLDFTVKLKHPLLVCLLVLLLFFLQLLLGFNQMVGVKAVLIAINSNVLDIVVENLVLGTLITDLLI